MDLKSRLPARPADAAFFPWYVGLLRVFYARAMLYFNIPLSIVTLLNFIMIFELRAGVNLSEVFGMPSWIVYGAIVVALPFLCVFVGYLDYRLKIQQNENILTVEHLAPRGNELVVNTREILKRLDELDRR